MRKFSLKPNLAGKKSAKRKISPTQSTLSQFQQTKKTIQEIYSGQANEKTIKKVNKCKKSALGRKSSTKTIATEGKKPKIPKTKTHQHKQPLNSNRSELEIPKKSSERNRAGSVLELNHKKYLKTVKKSSKKSPKSENLVTLKSRQSKIFDLIKTRLKCSKPRTISSRRASKDLKKSLKSVRSNSLGKAYYPYDYKPDEKYEKISFQHPVSCRENYFEDPDFAYKNHLEPCKTLKSGHKNLSLLDTEELCNLNDLQNPSLDQNIQKLTKNANLLLDPEGNKTVPDPPKFNFPVSAITLKTNKEKIIENFIRNRAAKIIQRNFRKYLQTLHSKSRTIRLQELLKDQIGWKEAQILTLEYLKQKEIEDLQFLSGMLGRNSPLEKLIAKTVQDRYENFSKFFKENLDKEKLKLESEKIENNEKVNEKKEGVSKIIQENNMNCSLSKLQIESFVKCDGVARVLTEEKSEITEKQEEKIKDKGDERLLGNKNLFVQETENFDPVLLSPIFPESINFPDLSSLIIEEDKDDNGFSVPEPLGKVRIEDFSLESLISAHTPQNRNHVPLLKMECVPVIDDILVSDKRIETHSIFIEEFLNKVFKEVENCSLDKILEASSRDPLDELDKIHNDFNEFGDKFIYEPILDIDQILINHFRASENLSLFSTDRVLIQADKIHKKMVLSAANEILQYFRPFGVKGIPQPWSYENRTVSKNKTPVDDILQGFILYMMELASCQIGKIPTENMILPDGNLDEQALSEARTEALEFSIKKDAVESEWMWIDFEFEETQVKLDLADIVLSELSEELVNLILN